MTAAGSSYKGFRFPPEIISPGVWLYHRFPLSFRDVQELMLERGVDVVYIFGLGVQRCPCAVRIVAGCMLIQNMSLSPRAQDRRRAVSAV